MIVSDLVFTPSQGGTSATLSLSTDTGEGNIYVVVLTVGSASPSDAQIEAGTDGDDVAAAWSGSISMFTIDSYGYGPTGLESEHEYKAYAVQKVGETYSNVISSEVAETPKKFQANFSGFARSRSVGGRPGLASSNYR